MDIINKSGLLNKLLWAVAIILLALGIWANYHFSTTDISLRLIAWLILVAIILAILYQTPQGRTAWNFAKEARIELRKVVWPTRQETFQMTLMVVVLVIAIALIIWGIDTIFFHLFGWLTGQR